MKNTSLLILSAIVLIIGGLGAFVWFQKEDETVVSNKGQRDTSAEVIANPTQSGQSELSHGAYVVYTPEVFASTATSRRVLFFYANWCPTCKSANESLTQNISKLPVDVTVIRVNYSDTDTDQSEKDLAKKYGITYQHTFVQIDEQGNEVAKWNGGKIDELLENLK